ncbi:MAG TPA: DUF4908 domain-containing protein [Caulobacteraceae bacterium]|jgi:hypothetical protein
MVSSGVVSGAGALALSAAALGLAPPTPALAHSTTLREALFSKAPQDDRRAPTPPVARYISADGQTFVLDKSTGTPLLKFQGSTEVWVLRASPAPRGDIIFRNDMGQPVLRATRLGGVTLFARSSPGGAPAAVAGAAGSLRLQAMNANALLRRMAQASLQASRAAGRLIPFDAPDVVPGSEAVYADAAYVAAEAVVGVAARKGGKKLLARVRRIQFTQGPKAEAAMGPQQTLRVVINPKHGLAGRPSSGRIATAATGK